MSDSSPHAHGRFGTAISIKWIPQSTSWIHDLLRFHEEFNFQKKIWSVYRSFNMFLTRMSTYMNSTSYIHTEVKHEDATESLQTNAKDERKVAPPPTNAKERILKFDQIHQHPVDLWVIILPTQTVHFPLMKIRSNYQTIFHIKLDPPKNLGQKIPTRSDPWIQNTKNVPPLQG